MRAALLGVLMSLPCLAAEEDEEAPAIRLPELIQIEDLSDEKAGKAFAILGQVTIEPSPFFSVRARRMIVWLDPKFDEEIFNLMPALRAKGRPVPLWAVRAVYAEGARSPAIFQAAGSIFRCSSFYYDFTDHTGLILDADLRLPRTSKQGEIPDLVFRAKKFRSTGPGEWRASDVTAFSSDYHEPDVLLEVSRLTLRDKLVRKALGQLLRIRRKGRKKRAGTTRKELAAILLDLEKAAQTRAGKRVRLEGLTGRALGVPFFRWRKLEYDSDEAVPLRLEFDAGGRGSLGDGARLGVGLATKPVAWLVGMGYYEGRGPLFDLEIDVESADGDLIGRSYGAYMHDRGTDFGVVPSTRNRYWVKHQYRWLIGDAWRLDGEYADLSDATWLRVFDERELKEGKEQETLLYLRRRGRVSYWTLTGKVRAIDFLDVLEEAPRVTAVLPALTLLDLGDGVDVQLAGTLEAANLRFRSGDVNPGPDFRTLRLDADPTVYVSFPVGPWRVVPFSTFRFTTYEHDLAGSGLGRFAGTAGIRADIQLWRRYGPVRHVVNVSLQVVDLYAVSESASRLFPLDDVDRITRFEMVGVRVRNRWFKEAKFLDLEIFATWFPGGERPLGARGEGFIELDMEWRPRPKVAINLRASYDWDARRLDTGSIEGSWDVRRNIRLGGGLRHLEGDSDILTALAEIDVDTRWRIAVASQYDVKNGDSLDQSLIIQRLGQTAAVGVKLSFDPGDRDEFKVSLRVDLLSRLRRQRRYGLDHFHQRARWR